MWKKISFNGNKTHLIQCSRCVHFFKEEEVVFQKTHTVAEVGYHETEIVCGRCKEAHRLPVKGWKYYNK